VRAGQVGHCGPERIAPRGRPRVHTVAEVAADEVGEAELMVRQHKEVVRVPSTGEIGWVGPFVFGAVVSFDTTLVALATDRTAAEIAF